METATSCAKYSQVAGLVHMLGQDFTMMSCYNDILIIHVKILQLSMVICTHARW